MAAFSQTLDSIRGDDPRIALLVGVFTSAVLLGWASWFLFCPVRVLEVTEQACIETSGPAFGVETPLDGRVAALHLELGRAVAAGDVLVELDATTPEFERAQAVARSEAIPEQIRLLDQQLRSQEQALHELRQGGGAEREESREKLKEARARARMAVEEAQRYSALQEQGYLPELEMMHKSSEANARSADLRAAQQGEKKVASQVRRQESERRAELDRLRSEIVGLRSEQRMLDASIGRLGAEIEKRTLRSPASGTIAGVFPFQPGSFVAKGTRLASVVARGEPQVIAELRSATALGRVRPGQPARLRLSGFPWTEYGSLRAQVHTVGQQPKNGRVRAELTLEASSRIPAEHGLCGTLEIETERATPFALALRSAGERIGAGERRGP